MSYSEVPYKVLVFISHSDTILFARDITEYPTKPLVKNIDFLAKMVREINKETKESWRPDLFNDCLGGDEELGYAADDKYAKYNLAPGEMYRCTLTMEYTHTQYYDVDEHDAEFRLEDLEVVNIQ